MLNQFNEFVNNLKVEVTEDGDYFLGDTEGNQPDLEEGEVETNNCFLVDGENILVYISIPTRRKNFEFLIVGSGFGAEVYELGYYQADEEGFWEN